MQETLTSIVSEETDSQKDRYLTFLLGQEVFGIDIRHVTEIIGLPPVNSLPEMPDYIIGVINLRGNIFPVIDMRIRLKKQPKAYTDRTCIIVTNVDGLAAGLIVDQVDEVELIAQQDIVSPPGTQQAAENRYLTGIGKTGDGIRLLLDCRRLFAADDPAPLENK